MLIRFAGATALRKRIGRDIILLCKVIFSSVCFVPETEVCGLLSNLRELFSQAFSWKINGSCERHSSENSDLIILPFRDH